MAAEQWNPEGALPSGWKRFFDDMSGQWYFVHTSTQRSQWHRPPPEGYGKTNSRRRRGNNLESFPRLVMTPTGVETRRGTVSRREIPDSFVVSEAKVVDNKLLSIASVGKVGPRYPVRSGVVARDARQALGVPTVPARVKGGKPQAASSDAGSYRPYEPNEETTFRARAKWVNLPPPAPLVPVHRPAWDDRTFWALAGHDAEAAQRYERLWRACAEGDLGEVQRWVKVEGLDPSAPVPLGWDDERKELRRGSTPLHLALEGGHTKVVKFLLGRPGQWAALTGDLPSDSEDEDEHDGNDNGDDDIDWFSSPRGLGGGGGSGSEEKLLPKAKKECKLEAVAFDSQGLTPLMLAVKLGNKKAVDLLLSHDPSPRHVVNARDKRGANALHFACQGGKLGLVKMVVSKGFADPGCSEGRHRDDRGVTPLLLASRKGHGKVVDWLLNHCPTVGWDEGDDHGITPLMVFCERGDVGHLATLVEQGAHRILHPDTKAPVEPDDPHTYPANVKKDGGKWGEDELEALPEACAALYDPSQPGGRVLVPKQQRVWLDRADKTGRTGLGFAAAHGQQQVVECLLAAKGKEGRKGRHVYLVDETAKNGGAEGLRPADLAREKGHRALSLFMNQVGKQRFEEDKERRRLILTARKRTPTAAGTDGEAAHVERKTVPL